jgi:hypothetical protein
MVAQIVPLTAKPSQVVNVTLADQNCDISVYWKTTGMFFDLSVNGTRIVSCQICRDGVELVNQEYRGFAGNLVFVDTQGTSDPEVAGLGSRYKLVYTPAA